MTNDESMTKQSNDQERIVLRDIIAIWDFVISHFILHSSFTQSFDLA